jgi:hypothetical protein
MSPPESEWVLRLSRNDFNQIVEALDQRGSDGQLLAGKSHPARMLYDKLLPLRKALTEKRPGVIIIE